MSTDPSCFECDCHSQGKPSPRYELLHNIRSVRIKENDNHQTTEKENALWGKFSRLPFNPEISAAIRFGKWKLVTGLHGKY